MEMYFPYVRGRQYELLAIRELIDNDLIGDHIIPVVEPVKLSPTLINAMGAFIEKHRKLAIIRNPAVGSFISDYMTAKPDTKEESYRNRFDAAFDDANIIKSIIINGHSHELLNYWGNQGVKKEDLLVIANNRDYLWLYDTYFSDTLPKYALIPDESAFRRKIRRHRVRLDDKFEKQERNSDYQDTTDEFFSEDHIYFDEDGFDGFADYSIVGDEFSEKGFAPYAVAIHIVYFASDNTLRIKHFVSDSNEDPRNPALKFYEAVTKLASWYRNESANIPLTLGLKTFLEHYDNQTYPGLGTVKKLSLMHHIELISKYLDEVR